MADHHDVILRIEFLVRAGWDIAHGNILASLETRLGQPPGLAYIEQSECLTLFEQGLDLSGADFEVHK